MAHLAYCLLLWGRSIIKCLIPLISICGICTLDATPLKLEYSTSPTATGLYEYHFILTLDNHDNSFVLGQDWDWLLFGDLPASYTSPLADFQMTSAVPLPWTSLKFSDSSGVPHADNVPTFLDHPNPGWTPVLGDQLTWSGTSATYLRDGQLLFSTLDGSGVLAHLEVARHLNPPPPMPVPDSGHALTMLGLAAGLLAVLRSRLGAALEPETA